MPLLLFTVGVILGVSSGVLAVIPSSGAAPVVLGAGAAIAAIVLTFTVALQQNADTAALNLILIKIAEQTAVRDYEPDSSSILGGSPAGADNGKSVNKPSYSREAIEALQKHTANLNFNDLQWQQKVPSQGLIGNPGWFVESNHDDDSERWFVRKANGLTVRKAMPRKFLEALKMQEKLDPQTIKHDFQLSNHGLAAWYVRTYAGALWKVSKSNRNALAGIKVTLETEEP